MPQKQQFIYTNFFKKRKKKTDLKATKIHAMFPTTHSYYDFEEINKEDI